MKAIITLVLTAALLSWSCGGGGSDDPDTVLLAPNPANQQQKAAKDLKLAVKYDDGSIISIRQLFIETNDGSILMVYGKKGVFTLDIPKETIKSVYVWGRDRWPGVEEDNTIKLTQKVVTLPAGLFIQNVLEAAVRASGNEGIGKEYEKKWVKHEFCKQLDTETYEQFLKRKARLQVDYRFLFNQHITLFFGKYRLRDIKGKWVELGKYNKVKKAINIKIKVFQGLPFIVDLDDYHIPSYSLVKLRGQKKSRIIEKEMDYSWRDRSISQGERLEADLSGMISILYQLDPEIAACWKKQNYNPEINMEVEFFYCSGGSFTGRPYVRMNVISITVLEEPCE